MALSRDMQRATLAIRDVIAQGGRVLRSSRAFWARYGFPPLEQRTQAITTARELLSVANEIEAGSIRGTIAQALTDAGLPTDDLSGGLTGGVNATVYFRAEYTTARGTQAFRSFRLELPWYTSLDQIADSLESYIDDAGDSYGMSGGSLVSGSMVVY
jgi:hypothetical protein